MAYESAITGRAPKQYQITEIQMTKTKKLLEAYHPDLTLCGALEHSNFGFVSDFGIRISNLFTETQPLPLPYP